MGAEVEVRAVGAGSSRDGLTATRVLCVSAIVVSYNTRDLLRRALTSLACSSGALPLQVECLVIDNASHDGSAEMVEREFPTVRLFRLPTNRGFAAAVNLGLRHACGEYVLLLNPDAELLGEALWRLAQFLEEHPQVAAVGPQLVYRDGRRQHAAFTFPTLPMIFLDFFPLHGRLLDSRLNGRYPVATTPHPIDHPLGACMLIRRAALEDVGPLDEQFFMYCEEIDWCLRARRRGWHIYHVPQAVARHLGGQSTRQQRARMFAELHLSRLRLYEKHYGPLFRRLAKALTSFGLWAEARRVRQAAAAGRLSPATLAEWLVALDQVRQALERFR